MNQVINVLDRIAGTLSKPIIWIVYGFLILSATLVFIEVITRYGFSVSHAMAAETSKYALMVGAFLLAGVLVRKDEHFSIVIVIDRVKGKTKKIFKGINVTVNLIVSILIFAYSIPIVLHDYGAQTLTESFTFKVWWLHLSALIIGLGFLFFCCLVEFLKFFFRHDTPEEM